MKGSGRSWDQGQGLLQYRQRPRGPPKHSGYTMNLVCLSVDVCLFLLAVNTHVHADHVTASGELKKWIPDVQSIVGEPRAKADICMKEGDKIYFGDTFLECRATPGHTDG